MAKKVVASLRDTSGVKYAKLIQSVKSEKTGSYSFKEEIIIEDHVKDILAGKSHEDIISCLLYTSPSPRDRTRSRMPSSA